MAGEKGCAAYNKEGPLQTQLLRKERVLSLARLWGLWEKSLRSVCVCQVHAK